MPGFWLVLVLSECWGSCPGPHHCCAITFADWAISSGSDLTFFISIRDLLQNISCDSSLVKWETSLHILVSNWNKFFYFITVAGMYCSHWHVNLFSYCQCVFLWWYSYAPMEIITAIKAMKISTSPKGFLLVLCNHLPTQSQSHNDKNWSEELWGKVQRLKCLLCRCEDPCLDSQKVHKVRCREIKGFLFCFVLHSSAPVTRWKEKTGETPEDHGPAGLE